MLRFPGPGLVWPSFPVAIGTGQSSWVSSEAQGSPILYSHSVPLVGVGCQSPADQSAHAKWGVHSSSAALKILGLSAPPTSSIRESYLAAWK